jgi:hypothetical protein
LRASVAHIEAVSGALQRDATAHRSIAAKVASGLEVGNYLDHDPVTAIRRTDRPFKSSRCVELRVKRPCRSDYLCGFFVVAC